jgi:hypothetical protein
MGRYCITVFLRSFLCATGARIGSLFLFTAHDPHLMVWHALLTHLPFLFGFVAGIVLSWRSLPPSLQGTKMAIADRVIVGMMPATIGAFLGSFLLLVGGAP